MKRHWWNSGWERPVYQWCKEGCPRFAVTKDGLCSGLHRSYLETREITANPMVRWGDVNLRRYNVLDRTRERMAQAVALQEEGAWLRLQNHAATLEPNGPQ